jgi:hypothetical protein
MSESDNAKNLPEKKRKKSKILIKIFLLLTIIAAAFFALQYFKLRAAHKAKARAATEKFDNIDGEIFDLSDEYKSGQNDDSTGDLADSSTHQLHEKNIDFVYQNLLKNQVQINDLRNQINELKLELNKYKAHEVVGRVTYSYIDFRQNLFAGRDAKKEFKNFETLASFDVTLQAKADKLKNLLPDFYDQKILIKSFGNLIPEIITVKKNIPDSGVVAKIRRNISKLVVIRKISNKEGNDVDAIIRRIEDSLLEENYQEALNNSLLLDETYHEVLKDFLTRLAVALEVQKTDLEILNYLKILS